MTGHRRCKNGTCPSHLVVCQNISRQLRGDDSDDDNNNIGGLRHPPFHPKPPLIHRALKNVREGTARKEKSGRTLLSELSIKDQLFLHSGRNNKKQVEAEGCPSKCHVKLLPLDDGE